MGSIDTLDSDTLSPNGSPGDINGNLDTDALESLETHEQRRVLDIVSQLRKCGLDSVLSLPQLVVCGDQSAGKSSVLEALTGVPFPRKDNLCTRYPTEIILRRGVSHSLQIKVIPDSERSAEDKATIENFRETITSFDQLPEVMDKAKQLMGIEGGGESVGTQRAFARDVLSVEIEGPNLPQLTVVDLPGIIQSETKDASQSDVAMTVEITELYISQPRTICLAVVSAANDYANQPILNKVRQFDPKGERTLGIITKPDIPPPGSETETAFIELAKNKDIFFALGWHVLKNREFKEAGISIQERNLSEQSFFRKSAFGKLPKEHIGIGSLVSRLSSLLFTHVRQELPKLQEELDATLHVTKSEIDAMGTARATTVECREFLSQLGLNFYEICKSAVNGNYEGDDFKSDQEAFSLKHLASIRRLRAAIQVMNQSFAECMRTHGNKFQIQGSGGNSTTSKAPEQADIEISNTYRPFAHIESPQNLSHQEAVEWANNVVTRARGREILGNFNPLVIAELFWEQSSKWNLIAEAHIDGVSDVCSTFLQEVLKDKAPSDMYARMWPIIRERVKARHRSAVEELEKILKDNKSYVMNYNHYYTDTIKKRQAERQKIKLRECLEEAATEEEADGFLSVNVNRALHLYSDDIDPDMDNHSSDEVLDCLLAIYKVYQKVFIANVTVQVVERHIVQDLQHIFCPLTVAKMSDAEVCALASEPVVSKRQREFLTARLAKLEEGREILKEVMSTMVQ
ncbi:hypothetical protein DTO166G4_6364 [Paecilomyces variotii]|nr:hypothetical protein DTO166G4_6364 [Paecilomyces variotii]KAJ9220162.1 hypothetical protein DTO169C6_7447 [Paecilomyces variotii]KAJ9232670.1 hypothetical protein DTO169E5_7426 [Paecilomyces variotii]KAJ9241290.1 hypothetical protein DTO166G5_1452 [Paecilomyces variotii]KAJ9254540.1 hypothetical protein DTO195F2_6644 [Paecilomyces variotii]